MYEKTGDTGAVPDSKRYKQTINGEEKQLGPKTYARFVKTIGDQTRTYLFSLSQDPKFNALPDDKKAEYIASVLRDINTYGKIVVLGDRPERPSNRVKMMLQQNFGN